MTSFFGRWPDFTNSDSLLLVTMDGTQLQVTGALVALGAMTTVGLRQNKKFRFNFNLGENILIIQGGGLRRGLMTYR